MARTFQSSLLQYLHHDAAVLTAVPITIACRIRPATVTGARTVVSLAASTSATHYHRLNLTTNKARIESAAGAGAAAATATATFNAGDWVHICAVFASSTSRSVYTNGADKVTNATSRAPAGIDRTSIAAFVANGVGVYYDGDVDFVAIWNVALSDGEVASIAGGTSPADVQSANLVAFWQLTGTDSPEIDSAGNFDMTVEPDSGGGGNYRDRLLLGAG